MQLKIVLAKNVCLSKLRVSERVNHVCKMCMHKESYSKCCFSCSNKSYRSVKRISAVLLSSPSRASCFTAFRIRHCGIVNRLEHFQEFVSLGLSCFYVCCQCSNRCSQCIQLHFHVPIFPLNLHGFFSESEI